MMEETAETARVGISGGDTKAIKVFLQQKSVHELNRLERVIVLAGGNDLCKRISGPNGFRQVPNQTAETVRARLEELARFIQTWVPHADVVTTDVVPRESEGGFHNARARLVGKYQTLDVW